MSARPQRPRKKRKQRKSSELGDRIEALGESFLLIVWRSTIRVLRTILAGGRSLLLHLSEQPSASKIVIGLLFIITAAFLYHRHIDPDRREVWTDSEVEALARVIRSEVGSSSPVQRLHVAWATRNLAAERNQTIAAMACSPCGRQEPGRPVSSRQSAREIDRILAQHVLDQPLDYDPTGGASHFINPSLQDQLARSGEVAGYQDRTYEVVKRRWQKLYGWELYYRLGPDLEMWGPRRKSNKRARKSKR